METPQFHKIPFQYEGSDYELIISQASSKIGLPASLFSVYENNSRIGNVRFTPRLIAIQMVLTKTKEVYQGQIDKAAIKKFTESNWMKEIINKKDPEFIFEEYLDSLE